MTLIALVLAGGAGRRFGGGKLLAPWRGGRLIDGALAAAFAAPASQVILVTGADSLAVEAAARAFAEGADGAGRLTVVHAPDHAEGMAASLRAGIGAVPSQTSGVLVFLGDMPLVPHAVLAPLAEAIAGGAPAAAPLFDGRRGHPVAVGRGLFQAVLTLRGDQGARGLLDALGERLVLVAAHNPGVLLDVDSADDLASVR